MISVQKAQKTYPNGFQALGEINLEIAKGEIFALLGPNGAGKTTLISLICGLINLSSGRILVGGLDTRKDYKAARRLIGLVPQELTKDAFETVLTTVNFSRGLFGLPKDDQHIEKILKDLALWDKRHSQLVTLSGGMKRRVMIAKALAHEPKVLFLDEPTAGVDVDLRRSMWEQVRDLREAGVTIVLTTHYLEEAEEMADRVGVIAKGRLLLVEQKKALLEKFGKKELRIDLRAPLPEIDLSNKSLTLGPERMSLTYTYKSEESGKAIADVLRFIQDHQLECRDLSTHQSSLEEIFVELVGQT